ncbi:SpoIIE family protein phosphatase [Kitasatospora sp. NBC_01250]|uniref:SpoIIE family protein phosphatase n=1 Tax=Kitasatospora sp. NBC_01250 TaxID=2903571 RepID=UPI002E355CE8|nr:SpoIIE family protein phosphatase [Kitasatospora sp. NBC_01250]
MTSTSSTSTTETHPAAPEQSRPAAVLDGRGLVALWTPAAHRLLGYTAEEVVDRPVGRLLRAPLPAPVRRAVAEGHSWYGLLWARHRDGHSIEIGVEAHPCRTGDDRWRWVLLLEPAERRVARLVERAFTQSPIATSLYDTQARLVRANPQIVELAGQDEAEMLGRRIDEIHPFPPFLEFAELQRQALRTGRPTHTRMVSPPPSGGRERAWDVFMTPLIDETGTVSGVSASTIDVSLEHRARQRLLLATSACDRIGSTLDATRTAQELADTLVGRFADFAAIDLYESLLRPGRPAADQADSTLLRCAQASVLEGCPESPVLPGQLALHPPLPPFLAALRGAGPSLHQLGPAEAVILSPTPGSPRPHSLLLVPVTARGVTLGVAAILRHQRPEPFDQDDLLLAEEIVTRAGTCIDNARRYAHERDISLALQRTLLPHHTPEQDALDVAFRYLPAHNGRDTGGVWFDVIPLSGTRVALVAGDVTARGINASATTGRLRTAVRALADLDLPPDELLAHLDDLVTQLDREERRPAQREPADTSAGIGATCLYAVYDPVARRCTLASAGHPAPALRRPGAPAESVPLSAGPPLGTGAITFETTETELPEGSVLVLHSGYRRTPPGAGAQTVRQALSIAQGSPDQTCDQVLRALRSEDDVAVLTARTRGIAPSRVATWQLPADPAVVAEARAKVGALLTAWDLADLAFTTELVVTELVTNAIRYGRTPIELRLVHGRRLICEVSDAAAASPRLRRAHPDDEGGRGLYLVAQLTQRWGSRFTADGKTIWTEQDLVPQL